MTLIFSLSHLRAVASSSVVYIPRDLCLSHIVKLPNRDYLYIDLRGTGRIENSSVAFVCCALRSYQLAAYTRSRAPRALAGQLRVRVRGGVARLRLDRHATVERGASRVSASCGPRASHQLAPRCTAALGALNLTETTHTDLINISHVHTTRLTSILLTSNTLNLRTAEHTAYAPPASWPNSRRRARGP